MRAALCFFCAVTLAACTELRSGALDAGDTRPVDAAVDSAVADATDALPDTARDGSEVDSALRVEPPPPMVVSVGHLHGCAIRRQAGVGSRGELWCWGLNSSAQVKASGVPSNNSFALAPQRVLEDRDLVDVAAGDGHTCAIADDQVFCWGNNLYGQVAPDAEQGSAGDPSILAATGVALGRGIPERVSASETHSCVTLSHGDQRCWGNDERGALGDGEGAGPGPSPALRPDGSPLRTSDPMALGRDFSCARGRVQPGLWCWGENENLQLGFGPGEAFTLRPTEAVCLGKDCALSSGLVALAAARKRACAVIQDGAQDAVYCWGLGHGLPQKQVGLPGRVRAIAVSDEHGCAIVQGDSPPAALYCWGENHFGQLGQGDVASYSEPMPVELPAVPVSISVRRETSCAALENAGVYCWGASRAFAPFDPMAVNCGGMCRATPYELAFQTR